MANVLLVDVGNTRLKWRVMDQSGWKRSNPHDAILLQDCSDLVEIWEPFDFEQAWLTCVAGDDVFSHVVGLIEASVQSTRQSLNLTRVLAEPLRCGVYNGYKNPAQLGVDRWVAAIGAHALYPGRSLMIASLGTATTIDLVIPISAHESRFMGGVILPGVESMRQALNLATAQLPLANGKFARVADNTDDAIVSGILYAQAGAIERMYVNTQRQNITPPLCLLSGGAAIQVAPLLMERPVFFNSLLIEEHLVLRGLAEIVRSSQSIPKST